MRNYKKLANIVDFIHVIVIIFMIGGNFVPKDWTAIKIFHSVFGMSVFMSQLILGINCPLTVLSNYLRKKADPDFKIFWDSFTLKLAQKYLGVTLNQSIVFTCILILAVVCFAEFVTIVF